MITAQEANQATYNRVRASMESLLDDNIRERIGIGSYSWDANDTFNSLTEEELETAVISLSDKGFRISNGVVLW